MRGIQSALTRELRATAIYNTFVYELSQMKLKESEHTLEDQTKLLTILGNAVGAASPKIQADDYTIAELEPFKRALYKCDRAWFKYIDYLDKNGFDESCRLSQLALRQIVMQSISHIDEVILRGFCRGAGWDYDELMDSINDESNESVSVNMDV